MATSSATTRRRTERVPTVDLPRAAGLRIPRFVTGPVSGRPTWPSGFAVRVTRLVRPEPCATRHASPDLTPSRRPPTRTRRRRFPSGEHASLRHPVRRPTSPLRTSVRTRGHRRLTRGRPKPTPTSRPSTTLGPARERPNMSSPRVGRRIPGRQTRSDALTGTPIECCCSRTPLISFAFTKKRLRLAVLTDRVWGKGLMRAAGRAGTLDWLIFPAQGGCSVMPASQLHRDRTPVVQRHERSAEQCPQTRRAGSIPLTRLVAVPPSLRTVGSWPTSMRPNRMCRDRFEV